MEYGYFNWYAFETDFDEESGPTPVASDEAIVPADDAGGDTRLAPEPVS